MLPLAGIRREHGEVFFIDLQARTRPAAVAECFHSLQRLFRWLIDEGELGKLDKHDGGAAVVTGEGRPRACPFGRQRGPAGPRPCNLSRPEGRRARRRHRLRPRGRQGETGAITAARPTETAALRAFAELLDARPLREAHSRAMRAPRLPPLDPGAATRLGRVFGTHHGTTEGHTGVASRSFRREECDGARVRAEVILEPERQVALDRDHRAADHRVHHCGRYRACGGLAELGPDMPTRNTPRWPGLDCHPVRVRSLPRSALTPRQVPSGAFGTPRRTGGRRASGGPLLCLADSRACVPRRNRQRGPR